MQPQVIDIIDDDDDDDDFYYRNARVPPRRQIVVQAGSRRGRGRSRAPMMRPVRSPIVHKYGTLKWGLIADGLAKTLAAIQPLPGPPDMTGDVKDNLVKLGMYHAALAEHAKRSQQLSTIGSIAKVFLP